MGRHKEIFYQIFNQIVRIVTNKKYYVPRNYKTIGGMWTTDTYKKGDVKIMIMDEGYTIKLISPKVVALDTYQDFFISKGTLQDFYEVLEMVKEN